MAMRAAILRWFGQTELLVRRHHSLVQSAFGFGRVAQAAGADRCQSGVVLRLGVRLVRQGILSRLISERGASVFALRQPTDYVV